eukprot:5258644-Pleurochrysis_carterae.AAC.1
MRAHLEDGLCRRAPHVAPAEGDAGARGPRPVEKEPVDAAEAPAAKRHAQHAEEHQVLAQKFAPGGSMKEGIYKMG